MNDFEWSKAEKQVARRAFDLALKRECLAIRGELVQMLKADEDFRQIWRIHDYLSEQRREVDLKYDYRYSRLITVFGQLHGAVGRLAIIAASLPRQVAT